MRISKQKSFRLSMGNYGERAEWGASVTFDHQDLGYTDDEWVAHVKEVGHEAAVDELVEAVEDELANHLDDDVKHAVELREHNENDASVFGRNTRVNW